MNKLFFALLCCMSTIAAGAQITAATLQNLKVNQKVSREFLSEKERPKLLPLKSAHAATQSTTGSSTPSQSTQGSTPNWGPTNKVAVSMGITSNPMVKVTAFQPYSVDNSFARFQDNGYLMFSTNDNSTIYCTFEVNIDPFTNKTFEVNWGTNTSDNQVQTVVATGNKLIFLLQLYPYSIVGIKALDGKSKWDFVNAQVSKVNL